MALCLHDTSDAGGSVAVDQRMRFQHCGLMCGFGDRVDIDVGCAAGRGLKFVTLDFEGNTCLDQGLANALPYARPRYRRFLQELNSTQIHGRMLPALRTLEIEQ